ncbi:isopentenyl-diphosphate delta-isomerase [Hydrogenispora ethanolica]|jgi:isopentenyl-diphosphate delta-isomerase|uniref:Isopentenyl-diphosphate delta-isomerase n=1 Tax=Hydrogenispora ethanolica TaxID=1082276 RepID=A0A4R1S057_HYDET|nr:isopentenyl-diphosphate Delta-isomerase [Hydrogenispora ethanolica]TCL72461.1 isopentenyl-diphosphate delta-isomerase [Hydrogenispora ethanolica]
MNQLILVDLLDREIGGAGKIEAHREGLLHRAFSVFICHDGQMLLQKRAYHKYHSGGLWTNACCSHPRQGEKLAAAVRERLRHELNIAPDTCRVTEIFDFVYFQKYGDHLFEYEYDHVFLADYGGALQANPDEIAAIRWVALEDLQADLLTRPQDYSAWFLIAAPKVLQFLMRAERPQAILG